MALVRLRLLFATLVAVLALASGCASGAASSPRGPRDEVRAETEPEKRAPLSTDAIARTRGELQLLARDLAVLDGRLPAALEAVNFTVMRYPTCLDVLFDKVAHLDLDRREITLAEQDLRRTFDDIVGGRANGSSLLAVENKARARRDQIATMNGELAMIYAEAMSQRPSCAPKAKDSEEKQ
jgi:hypothetical protein